MKELSYFAPRDVGALKMTPDMAMDYKDLGLVGIGFDVLSPCGIVLYQ